MRFAGALYFLLIAFFAAGSAFFYISPVAVKQGIARAIADRETWHLRIDGQARGEQFQADLARHDGRELARISYPPLKIINNQWIELSEKPASAAPAGTTGYYDIFARLRLTRRLTGFRDLAQRVEKYEFAVNAELNRAFANLLPKTGVLTVDVPSGLPTELQIGDINISVAYDDPLENQTLYPRPLGEVIVQLDEFVKSQSVRPKKLSPLARGSTDKDAFMSDFDRDGLSDALELFYGTDPANPDTDSDAFLDGEEISRGYSPLKKE